MHYTSGTTGRPKGVKRPLHDADPDIMAELFTGFFNLFGIPHREDQVHLCTSPNYHTAVTTFAGNSLNSGHRVVYMDKWDPEADPREDRAATGSRTRTWSRRSSTGCCSCPEDVKGKYDVSSMRWAIHAAAPCPVDVKRKMLDWWGPVIWEYYDPRTEGGGHRHPEDWLKYPGTVGSPWADLRAEDHRRRPRPGRCTGRARHRLDEDGSQGFEYKGDQSKTDENHGRRARFFTVGDVGYLNEDGFLFLCDRKSDMIIARRGEHLPAGDRGRDPWPTP